ncbi:MAG: transglutaminase domain-containing protein [Planctomycetota bacterium]|jgi:hypothetical protein
MTTPGIGFFFVSLLFLVGVLTVSSGERASGGEIVLDAAKLYAGFRAQRVLPDRDKTKLVFDERSLKVSKNAKGVVTTDVLDLSPASGIASLGRGVASVEVEVTAESPEGAEVTVETRSGAKFFDQKDWSPWSKLAGLKGKVSGLKGHYFQVRVTLKPKDATKLPSVSGLKLTPLVGPAPPGPALPPLEVVENKLQEIVRSPVDFKHGRPDNPKLVKFKKAAKLDEVIAGKMDERLRGADQVRIDKLVTEASGAGEDFLQLVRLMDWTGACYNARGKDVAAKTYKKTKYYDWNIDSVWELVEVEEGGEKKKRPTIYGHCMSYSEVMATAAMAVGFKARHLSVVGVSERSHEVCEAWVPSLGKWVYFDPSLSNYYFDKETKHPLCIVEMHNVVTKNFIPKDKNMFWFMKRRSKEVKNHVRSKGGGQKPIGSRLGKWKYGGPMPADYDWGWHHGYKGSGFMQITPRNDFHENPKANPRRFEHYPGYGGYPNWVDAKTPPKRGGGNYFTRMRDFYWTLDQAGVKLTRKNAKVLSVELGNSMPFFKEYEVLVDGKKVDAAGGALEWTLKAGENKLEVTPVDEFGRKGLTSSLTLKQ